MGGNNFNVFTGGCVMAYIPALFQGYTGVLSAEWGSVSMYSHLKTGLLTGGAASANAHTRKHK